MQPFDWKDEASFIDFKESIDGGDFTDGPDSRCPEGMVLIPAGNFVMGIDPDDEYYMPTWNLKPATPKHIV